MCTTCITNKWVGSSSISSITCYTNCSLHKVISSAVQSLAEASGFVVKNLAYASLQKKTRSVHKQMSCKLSGGALHNHCEVSCEWFSVHKMDNTHRTFSVTLSQVNHTNQGKVPQSEDHIHMYMYMCPLILYAIIYISGTCHMHLVLCCLSLLSFIHTSNVTVHAVCDHML